MKTTIVSVTVTLIFATALVHTYEQTEPTQRGTSNLDEVFAQAVSASVPVSIAEPVPSEYMTAETQDNPWWLGWENHGDQLNYLIAAGLGLSESEAHKYNEIWHQHYDNLTDRAREETRARFEPKLNTLHQELIDEGRSEKEITKLWNERSDPRILHLNDASTKLFWSVFEEFKKRAFAALANRFGTYVAQVTQEVELNTNRLARDIYYRDFSVLTEAGVQFSPRDLLLIYKTKLKIYNNFPPAETQAFSHLSVERFNLDEGSDRELLIAMREFEEERRRQITRRYIQQAESIIGTKGATSLGAYWSDNLEGMANGPQTAPLVIREQSDGGRNRDIP